MNYADLIGRTLDEKYQIERELGRGGMGTVYLATHLGTERPVAIKVIAPQFMKRPEFVERFRREARAAGRLRHPNVVDVTDFGFAETEEGRVAYLVMEYLDGCTLGEILEEEKNLPVSWTLDILEQVCSAVHEAHEQGIIHRDLKPDNIWLEPNQRGGYTVKVLDFGIAKLETHDEHDMPDRHVRHGSTPTFVSDGNSTIAQTGSDGTLHESISRTVVGDRATAVPADGRLTPADRETLILVETDRLEAGTLVLESLTGADEESVGTKIISHAAETERADSSHASLFEGDAKSDLTRVGSVLGTPLYMSPEQCRGDRLDPRSDIYSIGIIAYQMLSGDTPFKGDFTRVMESHKFIPPPPLIAKKVRKKLKRVITGSLAKDPDDRPHSAEALANALRSRSEGIFGLLRRAGMIYTEHIQKFITLSTFFFLPMIVLTAVILTLSFLKASEVISSTLANVGIGLSGIVHTVVTAFCTFLIFGTIAWIVTQSLAVPLRPIKLRAALIEGRRKWKTFAGLGLLCTLVPLIVAGLGGGIVFGVIFGILWAIIGPEDAAAIAAAVLALLVFGALFFLVSSWLMLVAPVVMMENLRGWSAVKRSRALVSRSLVTAVAAFLIMFLMPVVGAGSLSFTIGMTAQALEVQRPTAVDRKAVQPPPEGVQAAPDEKNESGFRISLGNGNVPESSTPKDMRGRLTQTVLDSLLQLLLLPMQIIFISFTAIIVALLYLKTRQAGGESLHDLLANFEESDKPRKKWQERVRQRLIQSGRVTSRSG